MKINYLQMDKVYESPCMEMLTVANESVLCSSQVTGQTGTYWENGSDIDW